MLNYNLLKDFYAGIGTDLEPVANQLQAEMDQLRTENLSLKKQVEDMNKDIYYLKEFNELLKNKH